MLWQPSALASTDKSVPENVTVPLPCGDLDYEIESSHDGQQSRHGRGVLIQRKTFFRETHIWVDNGKKIVGARRVFLRRRWENARLNQIRKEIEGLSAVASVPAFVPQIRLGCSQSLAQVESPMWNCLSVAPLLFALQSSHVHATGIGTAAAAFPCALQAQVAEVEPVVRMTVVVLRTHLVHKGRKLHWCSGPVHCEASRTQSDIII